MAFRIISLVTNLATVFFLAIAATSAQAAQIFTDRALFEAAIGAGFTIEDFESAPLVGDQVSGATPFQDFGPFSVSSVPDAVKVADFPHSGNDNTTPGGQQYLYLDTDTMLQGSVVTITFDGGMSAVGFDYVDLNEPGSVATVTTDGQVFPLALTPGNGNQFDPVFWGIIGDAPIVSLTIDSGLDSGWTLDQLTYIPEPGTGVLLALGLAGLRMMRRRRVQTVRI